ncbi:MAG: hypothetical protein AB7J13_11305 [Pyrinomonadaceae bacterium]
MPTMIFAESAVIGDENLWQVLIGLVTVSATALAARFLYRKKFAVDIQKTQSETRKADIDMAVSILDRLPDFLRRLEDAHKKTLADETTIERLKNELEKCVDGNKSCAELKESLVVFLTDAERVIKKIDECRDLLTELRRLRVRLTK